MASTATTSAAVTTWALDKAFYPETPREILKTPRVELRIKPYSKDLPCGYLCIAYAFVTFVDYYKGHMQGSHGAELFRVDETAKAKMLSSKTIDIALLEEYFKKISDKIVDSLKPKPSDATQTPMEDSSLPSIATTSTSAVTPQPPMTLTTATTSASAADIVKFGQPYAQLRAVKIRDQEFTLQITPFDYGLKNQHLIWYKVDFKHPTWKPVTTNYAFIVNPNEIATLLQQGGLDKNLIEEHLNTICSEMQKNTPQEVLDLFTTAAIPQPLTLTTATTSTSQASAIIKFGEYFAKTRDLVVNNENFTIQISPNSILNSKDQFMYDVLISHPRMQKPEFTTFNFKIDAVQKERFKREGGIDERALNFSLDTIITHMQQKPPKVITAFLEGIVIKFGERCNQVFQTTIEGKIVTFLMTPNSKKLNNGAIAFDLDLLSYNNQKRAIIEWYCDFPEASRTQITQQNGVEIGFIKKAAVQCFAFLKTNASHPKIQPLLID